MPEDKTSIFYDRLRYIHISTRSNEGIRLLLVEPLDLERVIHKSMRAVDTLQAAIDSVEIQVSSDSVHPMLNDSVHPVSNNTVHLVSNDIVNLNNVHPVMNDTIHQSREWYDGLGEDPFQGLPHEDPMNHIEELKDLIKREDQIPRQLVDYIMAKSYEQHGFRELSGADEDEADIDLETSSKASINSHPPDIVNRYPPDIVDRHPPNCIDRHPSLDELLGHLVELEHVEERMHKCEVSHHAVHEHLRPPICAEEAAGFHKRVKRIHDSVKFVVSCVVFEVEFPIPPDRSVHLGSYHGLFDDYMYAVASKRGLRYRSDIGNIPTKTISIDTTTSSSVDTRCVSEQKEFEVYRNIFDGGTLARQISLGKEEEKLEEEKKDQGRS
ncbi:hypothetical protein F2Q68_00044152 [Brassica cretica]|uniref:Uncharacterized protein n=1 Tax=Brassica cretica TaxID=69181 RepID=A0A8S9LJX8_BRACR|nr:hypothetical protein F2Q68_00044152 [Brassica cretica]